MLPPAFKRGRMFRPGRHCTVLGINPQPDAAPLSNRPLPTGARPAQLKGQTMKNFLKLLLGSSLFLLERSDRTEDARDRAARKIDDLRDYCPAEV
jgi:hypothetical protein